jgi:hypothetical protein
MSQRDRHQRGGSQQRHRDAARQLLQGQLLQGDACGGSEQRGQ